MGDRSREADWLRKLISAYNPPAKTLLEIACGTGAFLKPLSQHYEVAGLDISNGMLLVAKKKLPGIKLYKQDMVAFRIPGRFDVILCLFDSINHVLKFNEWAKVFSRVHEHLLDNGIFIFDINTQYRLKLITQEPYVQKFGKNYMIHEVTEEGGGVVKWNIKILEHCRGNQYVLFEESVKEISFPVARIKKKLEKKFRAVRAFDPRRKRVSRKSRRVFFICKK